MKIVKLFSNQSKKQLYVSYFEGELWWPFCQQALAKAWFLLFVVARQDLSTMCTRTCIIVTSPLISINQISEMLLNVTAVELSSDKVNLVWNNPLQFLYCSAETELEKPFLTALQDSKLQWAMSGIVTDESLMVEA